MSDVGERYAMRLPNGETVSVTVTPEILAIAGRIRQALAEGRAPDRVDLRRLITLTEQNT